MDNALENLSLEPHADGVILAVKGAPGSKKNELRDITAGELKVCCTQIPEKGKANRALIEVLAKCLKLRKSQITLLSGETDSHKKFLFTDISEEELRQKIADALS